MRPKPDNNPLHLHPFMRAKCAELEAELEAKGLPFKAYEGFRGKLRQESGLKRGTTKASFGSSYHNFAGARDYVGSDPELNPWSGKLPWAKYGAAVKRVGLAWAGDWKSFKEFVHADCSPQFRGYAIGLAFLRRGGLAVYDPAFGDREAWATWLVWYWNTVAGMSATLATSLVQRALTEIGIDPHGIDGICGTATRNAIKALVGDDVRPHPGEPLVIKAACYSLAFAESIPPHEIPEGWGEVSA